MQAVLIGVDFSMQRSHITSKIKGIYRNLFRHKARMIYFSQEFCQSKLF